MTTEQNNSETLTNGGGEGRAPTTSAAEAGNGGDGATAVNHAQAVIKTLTEELESHNQAENTDKLVKWCESHFFQVIGNKIQVGDTIQYRNGIIEQLKGIDKIQQTQAEEILSKLYEIAHRLSRYTGDDWEEFFFNYFREFSKIIDVFEEKTTKIKDLKIEFKDATQEGATSPKIIGLTELKELTKHTIQKHKKKLKDLAAKQQAQSDAIAAKANDAGAKGIEAKATSTSTEDDAKKTKAVVGGSGKGNGDTNGNNAGDASGVVNPEDTTTQASAHKDAQEAAETAVKTAEGDLETTREKLKTLEDDNSSNPNAIQNAKDEVKKLENALNDAVIALLKVLTVGGLKHHSSVDSFEKEVLTMVEQVKANIEKLGEINDKSTAHTILLELYNVASFFIDAKTSSLKGGEALINFYQRLKDSCDAFESKVQGIDLSALKATHQDKEITLKDLKELIDAQSEKYQHAINAISELNKNFAALKDALETVKTNLDKPLFNEEGFKKLTSCLQKLKNLEALGQNSPLLKNLESVVKSLHDIINRKKIALKTTGEYDTLIKFYDAGLHLLRAIKAKGSTVTGLDAIIAQVINQQEEVQTQRNALAQEAQARQEAAGRRDYTRLVAPTGTGKTPSPSKKKVNLGSGRDPQTPGATIPMQKPKSKKLLCIGVGLVLGAALSAVTLILLHQYRVIEFSIKIFLAKLAEFDPKYIGAGVLGAAAALMTIIGVVLAVSHYLSGKEAQGADPSAIGTGDPGAKGQSSTAIPLGGSSTTPATGLKNVGVEGAGPGVKV